MDEEMLGPGRLAELSGLSPSALRFYDAQGVLRPDRVDEFGRRWYSTERVAHARLLSALRELRAPLDVLRAATAPGGTDLVGDFALQVECRLAELRRACERAAGRISDSATHPPGATACLPADDLAHGLAVVTATSGRDPLQPAMHSVRLAAERAGVTLETTDRLRLMRWRLRAETTGVGSIAVNARDAVTATAGLTGDVQLAFGPRELTLQDDATRRSLPATEFPTVVRGIVPDRSGPVSAPIEVGDLHRQLASVEGADRIRVAAAADRPPRLTPDGTGRLFSARLLSEVLWALPASMTCVLLDDAAGPLWVLPLSRRAEAALMPVTPEGV